MTSTTSSEGRREELLREGWQRQATYDEPRLTEMVELYRELGFEVRVEPFAPEPDTDCTDCMRAEPERFRTIFTRRG